MSEGQKLEMDHYVLKFHFEATFQITYVWLNIVNGYFLQVELYRLRLLT